MDIKQMGQGSSQQVSQNKTAMVQRHASTTNDQYNDILNNSISQFENTRKSVDERIKTELIPCMKKIEKVNDGQVIALSIYQECVEESASLRSVLSKLDIQYKKAMQDGVVYYTTSFPLGLKTNAEKESWSRVDNANLARLIDEIQNQLQFYSDTMVLLKNYNYALKNIIELKVNELL